MGRAMPTPRVIQLIEQVLSGLEHAHKLGLVHRDIKAENIFVTQGPDGKELLKIVDFGLVKPMAEEGKPLTELGMVFGTPEYMSPEQAQGRDVDGRADLYAVGVLTHFMLSGELPFTDVDPVKLLRKQIKDKPPALPQTVPTSMRDLAVPPACQASGKPLRRRRAGSDRATKRKRRKDSQSDGERRPAHAPDPAARRGTRADQLPGCGEVSPWQRLPSSFCSPRWVDEARTRARARRTRAPRRLRTPMPIRTSRSRLAAWWGKAEATRRRAASPSRRPSPSRRRTTSTSRMLTPTNPRAPDETPADDVGARALSASLAALDRLVEAKQFDAARISIEPLLDVYKDNAELRWRLGRVYLALKGNENRKAALEAYHKAVAVERNMLENKEFRAELFALLDDPKLRATAVNLAIAELGVEGHDRLATWLNEPAAPLSFAVRRRITEHLEASGSQARINKPLQVALDLWQAGASEDPCEAFSTALSYAETHPDSYLTGTLAAVQPPVTRAGDGSKSADTCARI